MDRIQTSITLIMLLLLISSANLIASSGAADSCSGQYPGDLNSDGTIDSLDLTFFQTFWWDEGPAPNPKSNADVNGDCYITDSDLEYLENYLLTSVPAPVSCTCLDPTPCFCVGGDANSDGVANISDVVYMISYIFAGGPRPTDKCGGDTNCDCRITVADGVGLIIFIFQGSSLLCTSCDDWISSCSSVRE